jgi:hypothetical protein
MLFKLRKLNHSGRKGSTGKGLRSVERKGKPKRPKNWPKNRLEQRKWPLYFRDPLGRKHPPSRAI